MQFFCLLILWRLKFTSKSYPFLELSQNDHTYETCTDLSSNHGSTTHSLCALQFSSVTQLCPTLCEPMDCSMPGFPVHYQLPELTQTHVWWVSDAIQTSHPLSLPSVFPSVSVFSNESVLCIRWPEYWSFSFSISPSNKYAGLISFRFDWFDKTAKLLPKVGAWFYIPTSKV